ncbi:MAG: F0F1 ATP synthase subunit B [Hyphomicrobiales bacterium]|nr:F0F1 ATP synthase subunit B [Hyphomicrobiales bacterium]
MLASPDTWVLVSFILFVALLVYYKIPSKVAEALDSRANKIKAELDEARRLREEAQTILADYQQKRRDAEKEAEDIIALARNESQTFAEQSKKSLKETLERRMKLAEEKITRAEEQAIQDIRSRSADVAITAAQTILAGELQGQSAEDLVTQGIKDVSAKLN